MLRGIANARRRSKRRRSQLLFLAVPEERPQRGDLCGLAGRFQRLAETVAQPGRALDVVADLHSVQCGDPRSAGLPGPVGRNLQPATRWCPCLIPMEGRPGQHDGAWCVRTAGPSRLFPCVAWRPQRRAAGGPALHVVVVRRAPIGCLTSTRAASTPTRLATIGAWPSPLDQPWCAAWAPAGHLTSTRHSHALLRDRWRPVSS